MSSNYLSVAVTGMYGVSEMLEMPPTPPPSSSNCSSDSEGGCLSPERSAPPSPSSSPYFTRTHLSFHGHSTSSQHTSLWTSSQCSGQQALFTSPVRAAAATASSYQIYFRQQQQKYFVCIEYNYRRIITAAGTSIQYLGQWLTVHKPGCKKDLFAVPVLWYCHY